MISQNQSWMFRSFQPKPLETVGKNPNQQLASILTVLRLEESERENQDFWREGGKVHLRKYRKKSSETSESKPTPFKHGAGVPGVSSFFQGCSFNLLEWDLNGAMNQTTPWFHINSCVLKQEVIILNCFHLNCCVSVQRNPPKKTPFP